VPIDVASYRRWEGRARPTRLAAIAIAAAMVRRRMRNRLVRFIIGSFTIVANGLAALFFYLMLEGRGNRMLQHRIREFGLDNVNLLALLSDLFDSAIGFWAVLLAALVGAPVIAEDRRAGALPLYFSRPIRHWDYVLGKAAATAFFLALLLVLPRISMYAIELAFSDAEGTAIRQIPTLLRSCATGGLGVLVLTSIALGISSLTDRPMHASFFLLGTAAFASGLSIFLSHVFRDQNWLAVSPYACVHRIGMEMMPVPDALRLDSARLMRLDVKWAWTGLGSWTALGLGTLIARIRRVEVVT